MARISSSAGLSFGIALLGSVASWALFLSYGIHHYEVWQIVGAGIGLVGTALVAGAVAGRGGVLVPTLGVFLGFVVPWALLAASQDATGLYLVGALMLTAATIPCVALVTWIGMAIARRRVPADADR